MDKKKVQKKYDEQIKLITKYNKYYYNENTYFIHLQPITEE